jgi:hypothetical protein
MNDHARQLRAEMDDANWRELVRNLTERVQKLERTQARHQELLVKCEPHLPDPDDVEPSQLDTPRGLYQRLYEAAAQWRSTPQGIGRPNRVETALCEAVEAIESAEPELPDPDDAEPAWCCHDMRRLRKLETLRQRLLAWTKTEHPTFMCDEGNNVLEALWACDAEELERAPAPDDACPGIELWQRLYDAVATHRYHRRDGSWADVVSAHRAIELAGLEQAPDPDERRARWSEPPVGDCETEPGLLAEICQLRPEEVVTTTAGELRELLKLEPGRVSISRGQWQALVALGDAWTGADLFEVLPEDARLVGMKALAVCRQLRDMPPPEPSLEEAHGRTY